MLEDDVGGAYGLHREEDECCRNFVGTAEGGITPGGFNLMVWEGLNWINPA